MSGAGSARVRSGDGATVDVSFVISTRNRVGSLPRTLDSIKASAKEAPSVAVEVVVVDNGSSDDTSTVVAAWADAAALPLTLLYEARPGLAAARNTGTAATRGRILALTDDDCVVDPSYVGRLIERFAQDPGPTLRGGRVDLGDPADLPITVKPERNHRLYTHNIRPGGFLLGCNMAFGRDVLERVGPFDERFGAGARFRSAEDSDFIFRASRAGVTVAYDPTLIVTHFHGRRKVSEAERLYAGYCFGDGALYAKHGLRDPYPARFLYHLVRNALREWRTGAAVEPRLVLSERTRLRHTMRGMLAYWLPNQGRAA